MYKILKLQLLAIVFIIFTWGCNKNKVIKDDLKPLNSFSMQLNNQLWQPSIIGDDSCMSAFQCNYTVVNQMPFYSIEAYKDPQMGLSSASENIFYLQIMNVDRPGIYNISEPFGSFKSTARFITSDSGTRKIYGNSVGRITSFVEIEEMLPNYIVHFNGIKGTFSGILYNTNNPNDSIIIDNCKFTFKKLNRNNFCQCPE